MAKIVFFFHNKNIEIIARKLRRWNFRVEVLIIEE